MLPEPATDASAPVGLLAAYAAHSILYSGFWRPTTDHAARINVKLLAGGVAALAHKRRAGTAAGLSLLQRRMGRATAAATFDNDTAAADAAEFVGALERRLARATCEHEAVRPSLEALLELFPAAKACAERARLAAPPLPCAARASPPRRRPRHRPLGALQKAFYCCKEQQLLDRKRHKALCKEALGRTG